MMPYDDYADQVRLLVSALPYVAREEIFASKEARPLTCSIATCRAYRLIST